MKSSTHSTAWKLSAQEEDIVWGQREIFLRNWNLPKDNPWYKPRYKANIIMLAQKIPLYACDLALEAAEEGDKEQYSKFVKNVIQLPTAYNRAIWEAFKISRWRVQRLLYHAANPIKYIRSAAWRIFQRQMKEERLFGIVNGQVVKKIVSLDTPHPVTGEPMGWLIEDERARLAFEEVENRLALETATKGLPVMDKDVVLLLAEGYKWRQVGEILLPETSTDDFFRWQRATRQRIQRSLDINYYLELKKFPGRA